MGVDKKTNAAFFQWDAGRWFASQFGASVWMLPCAFYLIPKDLSVAAVVFALFLAPNVVGVGLWAARRRIDVYPALQSLIALCGACALAVVHVVESAGLWRVVNGVKVDWFGGLEWLDGTISASMMKVLLIVMFLLVMVLFHRMQRMSRP